MTATALPESIVAGDAAIRIIEAGCPACGSDASDRLAAALTDVEDGVPGAYDVSRCHGCGLVFLSRRPDDASLPLCYRSDYHTRTGTKGLLLRSLFEIYHRLRFRDLAQLATAGPPAVLEIGCGDGQFLAFLERHWKGASLTGLDFVVYPEQLPAGSRVRLVAGSIEDAELGGPFDVVVAHNVLEHLPHPVDTLCRLAKAVKPGAVLTGQVPDWDSPWRRLFPRHWNGLHIPRHTQFFDERTLTRTLERAGFVVEKMTRAYDPGDWSVSVSNWITDTLGLRTRPRQAWFYFPVTLLGAPLGLLQNAVLGGHCALRFVARKQ